MSPVTRIKICGITREADAMLAERLGVDAVGFVFVRKSKRCVSIEQATRISIALGPFMSRVGLFLDDEAELVQAVLQAMPGLVPQFHGREPADFCDSFGRPYIKALSVGSGLPGAAALEQYHRAAAFLFDSHVAGELGGTGQTFDWTVLRSYSTRPIVLAGGLDENNIETAIATVQPYAIDVSSGVEQAPGIKDPQRMTRFVETVKRIIQ